MEPRLSWSGVVFFMQSVTFNEALNAIESLSVEDQEALIARIPKPSCDRTPRTAIALAFSEI
jgi:hypothetical protein